MDPDAAPNPRSCRPFRSGTDDWLRHTVVLVHDVEGWRIRHQHASVLVLLPDGDLGEGRVVLARP